MRYCLLNDCETFKDIRPCCLDCKARETCGEKCGKAETTFCVGLLEEKDD